MNKLHRIALIGAVEGTDTRRLEKDYILLVTSLRRFGGVYSDIDVHLLQPTDHDLLSTTLRAFDKLGVKFYKHIAEHNQSTREFNYTNKPIACKYFYDTISDNYDYFLWIDGDAIITKQPELPALDNNDIMYKHNNEYVCLDTGTGVYTTRNSPGFLDDQKSYRDMMHRIGVSDNGYVPAGSWLIFAKASNTFWSDWAVLTNQFISTINTDQSKKREYRFANNSLNFDNRVEELTLDIIAKKLNLCRLSPINVTTFATPDTAGDEDYVEPLNKHAWTVHYDNIDCFSLNPIKWYLLSSNLKQFLKKHITTIYGLDVFLKVYRQSRDTWIHSKSININIEPHE